MVFEAVVVAVVGLQGFEKRKKVSARSGASSLGRQDAWYSTCYTLFLRNLEALGNWQAIEPL